MPKHIEIPVLIVGAGPVGMSAALFLDAADIDSLVVDRREGPHRAPQAHVVNPRTLELCRQFGVDMAAIERLATPREDAGDVSFVTQLADREIGRLHFERQDDGVRVFTPTPLRNLGQDRFEPILCDRLNACERTHIEWQHQWTGCEVSADGPNTHILSLVTDIEGQEIHVSSRYLLACDGAGSPIRKTTNIQMIGPDRLESFAMIHFEANLRELVKDRPANLFWQLDPETTGVFVAHEIDRDWVYMHTLAPDNANEQPTDEQAKALVRESIGAPVETLRIKATSTWHMTAQVAESYREGNIFLVGDSAHRFPPTGGMGMNTGIQDAHNLAWKIAAVEQGWAGEKLLDTYENERKPVAEANSAASLENAAKMFELIDVLDLGNAPKTARQRMHARLDDPSWRQRIDAAIENQQDHFDMLALQLGFTYENGAVVPDGTDKPVGANPIRDYVPSSRPGSRFPHAWMELGGERISSLDLATYTGLTFIIGSEVNDVRDISERLNIIQTRCVQFGRELKTIEADARTKGELENFALILLRPDGHVAWRVPADSSIRDSDIVDALNTILMRTCR